MLFYLHEFDHSSPKKTEASKLTANHVGLSSKKEKIEQDLFCSEFSSMVIRVVEFSSEGKKLERFLPKNQHPQRKFLNFENWTNGEPQ